MRRAILSLRISLALWALLWHRSVADYHRDLEQRTIARLADLCARRQRLVR